MPLPWYFLAMLTTKRKLAFIIRCLARWPMRRYRCSWRLNSRPWPSVCNTTIFCTRLPSSISSDGLSRGIRPMEDRYQLMGSEPEPVCRLDRFSVEAETSMEDTMDTTELLTRTFLD